MSPIEEFRQALRNQHRLIKHRTDRMRWRLLVLLMWLVWFGSVFAVINGVVDHNLGSPGWWRVQVPAHMLVSLCITSCFYGFYRAFELRAPQRWIDTVNGWKDWRSGVFHSSFAMLCSGVGLVMGMALVDQIWIRHGLATLIGNLGFWREFALISVLVSVVMGFIYRARWKRELLQARASEAQLKLLQGQIEPHFLFNTLANVQSLVDCDPGQAKLMLERFTDYLRASLQQMRKDETTVSQEFTMMESYLGLMQIRMQSRLQFRFEVEPGLEAALIPPLLVQPLIENAIHHGLEPKIDGGAVVVRAWRDGDDLVIEVADDGQGLEAPKRAGRKGNGIAVENIRARLASRWGPRAHLKLTAREGGGTLAQLRLPLNTNTAAPT